MWRKPGAERVKLNFDGSSKHKSRSASIGGVYRDHEDKFVLGYAKRIGEATSSVAKLVALKCGLELVLENGWRSIWIEGDAKAAVDVVWSCARVRSEDLRQFREIAALLPLLDKMRVSHVCREMNKVATASAVQQQVWRDLPPVEVVEHLRRDVEGC